MRRFFLLREQDPSGVSGTGLVAEGVVFTDGQVALHWRMPPHGTSLYGNILAMLAVHGHGGASRIVWLDSHGGYGEHSARARQHACA